MKCRQSSLTRLSGRCLRPGCSFGKFRFTWEVFTGCVTLAVFTVSAPAVVSERQVELPEPRCALATGASSRKPHETIQARISSGV